jgi:hypothetical protein
LADPPLSQHVVKPPENPTGQRFRCPSNLVVTSPVTATLPPILHCYSLATLAAQIVAARPPCFPPTADYYPGGNRGWLIVDTTIGGVKCGTSPDEARRTAMSSRYQPSAIEIHDCQPRTSSTKADRLSTFRNAEMANQVRSCHFSCADEYTSVPPRPQDRLSEGRTTMPSPKTGSQIPCDSKALRNEALIKAIAKPIG